MGARRPKHVEKVCSNKICIFLHHVGVLFNLTKTLLVFVVKNNVNTFVVLVIFFNKQKWYLKISSASKRQGMKPEVWRYDPQIKHSPFRRNPRPLDIQRKRGTWCRLTSRPCWPFVTERTVFTRGLYLRAKSSTGTTSVRFRNVWQVRPEIRRNPACLTQHDRHPAHTFVSAAILGS